MDNTKRRLCITSGGQEDTRASGRQPHPDGSASHVAPGHHPGAACRGAAPGPAAQLARPLHAQVCSLSSVPSGAHWRSTRTPALVWHALPSADPCVSACCSGLSTQLDSRGPVHANGQPPQRTRSAVSVPTDMDARGIGQGDDEAEEDDDQPLLRTASDAV